MKPQPQGSGERLGPRDLDYTKTDTERLLDKTEPIVAEGERRIAEAHGCPPTTKTTTSEPEWPRVTLAREPDGEPEALQAGKESQRGPWQYHEYVPAQHLDQLQARVEEAEEERDEAYSSLNGECQRADFLRAELDLAEQTIAEVREELERRIAAAQKFTDKACYREALDLLRGEGETD